MNALNNELPDDLLNDFPGDGLAAPVAGPGVGIIASSAPTSVVGSMSGGPQVVVATGGMNNASTMNGVTTNSMNMGNAQPMVRPGGPGGMPVTSNPNLNILPQKLANGPTGPDGMNNGGMMMIPGPNMGGAVGGMQPQPMNKMMTIRQPNNIVQYRSIQVSSFISNFLSCYQRFIFVCAKNQLFVYHF